MYGIQTEKIQSGFHSKFENDVKMYGIQTSFLAYASNDMFENDVKMYGIQTSTPVISVKT